MSQHPGIKLRISVNGTPVLDGDSDWLHFQARWVHDISTGQYHAVAAHCDDEGNALFLVELMPVMIDDTPPIPDDVSAIDRL